MADDGMAKGIEWDVKAAEVFAQYYMDKKAGLEKDPEPDQDDSLDSLV